MKHQQVLQNLQQQDSAPAADSRTRANRGRALTHQDSEHTWVHLRTLLLEYSDRCLHPHAQQVLTRLAVEQDNFVSGSQVNAVFQRGLAVDRPQALFKDYKSEKWPDSFEVYLRDRAALSLRRGDDTGYTFFNTLETLLFGNHDHAVRKAVSALLKTYFGKQKPDPALRERCQLFLFQQWLTHIFTRASLLSKNTTKNVVIVKE